VLRRLSLRWFSDMVNRAFKREMSAAECRGYSRGYEAGHARGLDQGFDKWAAHAVHGERSVDRGARDRFAATVRGEG